MLRRLDRMEPADARVWAAETYWGVGITLRAQGCMLEAAMAFAEVLREWRDPAWDLLCIRGARVCLRTYAKEMGIEETPEMDELLAMADGWQATSVLSRQLIPEIEPARAAYDRRDFEEALEHLRPIEHDSTYFHPAQVMIGHCLQRLGRDDAALEHWGAYVKAHQGPGSLRPTSPALDKLRRESVARATFYLGKAQHERARARFAASGGRNTAGFVAVVERLGTFGEDFPASDVIAPVVGDLLVDSYLRLGRFGEACRVHERLVRDWPGNRFTRGAGRRVVTLFGAAGFR